LNAAEVPKTYRVGIVACGGIAYSHAAAYRACGRTEIVAAVDVDKSAVEKFAETFKVPRTYTSLEEMLAHESLDLVSVCTYPVVRRDITVRLAAYGLKGIYCEKPMCMDLREADEMVAACEQAGAVLIVGHQRRFEATYIKAKQLLDSGAIGELYRIEASCPAWDLFEWGTHWIDMMLFYNNDVGAEWVFGQVDRRWDRIGYGHRMETECISHIGFKNGVRGIFEAGDHAPAGFYNRLVGTEGLIEVNMPNRPRLRARVLGEKNWVVPQVQDEDPFRLTVESLVESVETGKPHPLSGHTARAGMEIMMATYESALTGKLVELPLLRRESPFGRMLERVGIPLIVS